MKTILCQNEMIDPVTGKRRKCNRFLGRLTDTQVEALKYGGHSTFRCPRCPSEFRWVGIRCELGKFVFFITDERPNFEEEEMRFDIVENIEQVG